VSSNKEGPALHRHLISIALAALIAAQPAQVRAASHPAAETQALDLAKETIALRSVRGEGNATGEVAEILKKALVEGGWANGDVEIVPYEDTAYLIATWQGSDPSLGPIVISAHMDVVEAKPEDWERDPFTPVIENGYLYGRGASDTKFDAALAVAAMIELRRQGFKPKRSIVIAYSGDEETTMLTSQIIAERLKHAKLVLNIDGASGTLDEETGKPMFWSWQGAEKTYGDFELVVTNPGGHSSTPHDDNAIAQLSAALERIGAYRFTPELNDITRDYFAKAAAFESDPLRAAAMRAFAADPADKQAIAVLRGDPAMIGKIGTTCVPTMVNGGHALNALPQRATAIVNCRIFPGHTKADIMAELAAVADQPDVKFSEINPEYVTTSPASPLDADFVRAATNAVAKSWGQLPVIASQSSGASDSMWYRALGVPSYGASGSFMKDSDDYSHGLNERYPLVNVGPVINYYLVLLKDLAAK
jgi:acetylornithine deacetylase/succinyl-diaminopimelate desuccinylase-like protein